MARLMLTRLSAITPRPTQRLIPASPLYRLRPSPCRRLTTLMRPSQPVRHFWPLRNQRFFCSRLRSGLLREDFPDMDQMTREGNNWRNFREAGDLSAMEFSIGPSDCWAIEKRGPQWGGGHVWVIHASFCRADGHPAEPADLDRVLSALQVRQYESIGNLQLAPQ